MSKNLEKLQALLAEMFQFDHADLDFGIYRIMNSKRDEISRFLHDDLLPQVKTAFLSFQSADKAILEQQFADTIKKLQELKVDPSTNDVVRDLQERLKSAVDVKALEEEVYSHLTNFFRRYYQDGDFLSLRRYKEGVYAIPYEGEEVKLHWANADQYYVKTSEYFRDYAFKTSSGKRVHFKLVEADTEKDNVKEEAGKERRFILCAEEPYRLEGEDLVFRFEYRADADKRKQADLILLAFTTILAINELGEWLSELSERRPTPSNANRTLLEKHLTDYTARNTFDYFIHKDLGGFLRRELGFYIKNEIMHLDDIQEESAPKVVEYLSKIKVVRQIAHKVIEFLAQIENFQKRIWLKKKFVVETNYCMSLDSVPVDLYPEIVTNEKQRLEWVRLLSIDEISGDLATPGYSIPLTADFLKANLHMVLDTRFFSREFVSRLLQVREDLDAELDGLLVHSENYQALRLLKNRCQSKIDAAYIDPPYNRKKDIFQYKDGYKSSSWLSMIMERVKESAALLQAGGPLWISIDRNEVSKLRELLCEEFGFDNNIGEIVWHNARDNNPTQIAIEHEYLLCFVRDKTKCNSVWIGDFSQARDLLVAEYRRLKERGLQPDEIQSNLREFIKDNEESLAEVDRYKFVDADGVYTGSQSVHNPHPGGYEYEILHPGTKCRSSAPLGQLAQ
jgi:adenine-specific DNA-methyltransferase